jgi:hypothetical protein
MNEIKNVSIDLACKRFCEYCDYIKCIELGAGAHAKVYKVTDKNTERTLCFKIIPEADYKNCSSEWPILELLRKFKIIIF